MKRLSGCEEKERQLVGAKGVACNITLLVTGVSQALRNEKSYKLKSLLLGVSLIMGRVCMKSL
jgi:hypothetical protein